MSVLALAGCGIKGPPVPPEPAIHLPAATLTYRLEDNRVMLIWHMPERLDSTLAADAAFDIYRSRSTLRSPACKGCPLVFEKVAGLPYGDTDDDRWAASQMLDAGYRYAFKVRLNATGGGGADSNTLRFIFDPDPKASITEAP